MMSSAFALIGYHYHWLSVTVQYMFCESVNWNTTHSVITRHPLSNHWQRQRRKVRKKGWRKEGICKHPQPLPSNFPPYCKSCKLCGDQLEDTRGYLEAPWSLRSTQEHRSASLAATSSRCCTEPASLAATSSLGQCLFCYWHRPHITAQLLGRVRPRGRLHKKYKNFSYISYLKKIYLCLPQTLSSYFILLFWLSYQAARHPGLMQYGNLPHLLSN